MTSKGEFTISVLKPLYPEGLYILQIYEKWCQFKPIHPGSYKNFREALRKMREDGKIEVYKTEPRSAYRNNLWDNRRYYRVTGKF